jgi:post-segregation antitoxin (ccd killing protein)
MDANNSVQEWGKITIPAALLKKMKDYKKKTKVPVSAFAEEAINREFKRVERKSKNKPHASR